MASSINSPSKSPVRKFVQINSHEEASAVISNLRKLKTANERLAISSTSASDFNIRSIEHFDRVVLTTCSEMRENNDKTKRIQRQIQEDIPLVMDVKEHEKVLTRLTHESDADDNFKQALLARIYSSPKVQKAQKNGNESDEWSDTNDDDGDKPPEDKFKTKQTKKFSSYDSDEEGLLGPIDDFSSVFKKSLQTDVKIVQTTKKSNTFVDDAEFTYGDDDNYCSDSSEINFSTNSKTLSKAGKRLLDAKAAAESSSTQTKSISTKLLSRTEVLKVSTKSAGTGAFGTTVSSGMSGVMSVTPGQRIRVKPPGRRKL